MLSLCSGELTDALLSSNAIFNVQSLKRREGVTLYELLLISALRDATDERDKVYAILGLVDGGQHFQADYNKNLVDVYYDVLLKVVEDRKDYELLTWIQHNGDVNEKRRNGHRGFPNAGTGISR